MKIWVIEQGSYSNYRVVGVFTSKENAQIVVDVLKSRDHCYDEPTIAEWALDPVINEINQGYHQYNVHMAEDGTTERIAKIDMSSYDLSGDVHMWRRSTANAYKGKGVKDILTAIVWAKDETHAVKIANEHRMRMIASGEWYKDNA